MRRPLAAVAIGSVVGLALAGCGLPDGVDGDMTGDWAGFPEPVGFVPAAPVCHAEPYASTVPLSDYRPVDCDEPHLAQTLHVGTFTEEASESESPPEAGSAEQREAYAECEERAEELLGADFRYGRLWLGVAVPSEAGWAGGARWFRCDLSEIESVRGATVEREESLAGALEPGSALSLGCFTAKLGSDSEIEERTQVPCDETHEAEFVGVWRAPDGPYLSFEDRDDEEQVYEGCREAVADYVDVPKDGNLIFRTGVIADWMSESDWDSGDRAFRCYLWLPEQDLTESLAGAGEDSLPIHTE